MQKGAQAFQSKLDTDGDGQIEISDLVPALTNLFTNAKGDMDLSSILSNLKAGGLVSAAQSWLGDGENAAIDGEQTKALLGLDTITEFADKVGLQVEQAVDGLQEAIPQIVDQASTGAESLKDIAGDLLKGDTASVEALFGDTASTVSDAASSVSSAVSDFVQGNDTQNT